MSISPKFKIRQAGSQDVETLSRLCAEVQQMHAEAYPEIFKEVERPDFAVSFFYQMLANPDHYFFLAEGELTLGYVFVQMVSREGGLFTYPRLALHIDQIGVTRQSRGKGVGAALLARVSELADELGAEMITLDSWEFNTDAHAFFRSQGFELSVLRMWKR
jgi:GNAT superfamily N-acetyltransferase